MNSSRLLSALLLLTTLCVVRETMGCSCLREPRILQDSFCKADYVLEIMVVKDEILQREENPFGLFSLGQRRYTVQTTKVFKTTPAYDAVESKEFIYTAQNSAACGVFLEEGVKYVIFGSPREGVLHLNLCSFVGMKSEELTAAQICGLDYAYSGSCDHCEIEYCMEPEGCEQQQQQQLIAYSQSCVVNHGFSGLRCYNDHAICKSRKSRFGRHVCDFVDVGSNDFSNCLNAALEP